MSLTLDQLIELLQKLKAEGVDGAIPVGIPSKNNDGKFCMVELDVTPCVMPIAKDEFEKGWTLCRKVSRGGLPALVISG